MSEKKEKEKDGKEKDGKKETETPPKKAPTVAETQYLWTAMGSNGAVNTGQGPPASAADTVKELAMFELGHGASSTADRKNPWVYSQNSPPFASRGLANGPRVPVASKKAANRFHETIEQIVPTLFQFDSPQEISQLLPSLPAHLRATKVSAFFQNPALFHELPIALKNRLIKTPVQQ
mmetsp:Transcript_19229/g.48853  ORF Transcript_19229/g.48853 Transcript_19229/m.48853 type:complete len:178 (-) Transcript_19229:127-660(-)